MARLQSARHASPMGGLSTKEMKQQAKQEAKKRAKQEVPALYVEAIRERDGALVRYCRADKDCPKWSKAWDKRVDLVRHIQDVHGITIDLPHRSVGRPKSSQAGVLGMGSRSHRQAKTRFGSLETRIKLARRKHKKDLHEGAETKWKNSPLNGKMPYARWLQKYIKDKMAEWEKGMPDRIAKMKSRIKKGYYKMSRKYKTDKEEHSSKETESEDDKGNEFITSDKNAACSSSNVRRKVMMDGEKPQKKLCKLEIRRGPSPSKGHIDVSSPRMSTGIGSSLPTKNRGLSTGMSSHLHSTRYGLEVVYDKDLISNITRRKACSRIMILFVIWLERTLGEEALDRVWFVDSLWYSFMETNPSERAMRNYYGRVDLSTRVFTFFPIVDNDHWTLVVFFNCHLCLIFGLPKDKSAIFFFDSLSIRSLDWCISPLMKVLQHLSAYTMCSKLKMELSHVESCHAETMMMPRQPNTQDCGYYIMVVMKRLLLAGLERLSCRRMFTENWFAHEDVEAIKSELSAWVLENTK